MDHTGLLRRFFLLSTALNAILLLGFVVYIYHDCYRTVQKESGQSAERLQKVFLLEVESTLEEMMVFGKEQLQKPTDIRLSTEKTLFFHLSSDLTGQAFFQSIPQMGRPIIDERSGLWVIPSSLSVLDASHREIGKITKHINMRKLTDSLRKNTYQLGKVFAVLDPRFGAVFQSENNPGDHKSLIYTQVLKKIGTQKKGWIDLPWTDHDVRFLSFLQIPQYPYMIVAGVQPSYLSSLIISRIFLILPYSLLAFLLCIMGLWAFSYRKQASFSRYKNLLRKYLLQFCVETVADTLKACRVPANKLKTFAHSNPITLPEKISFNALVEECLLLLEPDFVSKGVQLKTAFCKNPSEVTLQVFEFQKLFLNAVRLSLESCAEKGFIKIETREMDDKMLLIIEDSGFHLSLEDRMHFSSLKNDAFSELGFQAVMQLIKDMEAEIVVTMKEPKGNVMTLSLAFLTIAQKDRC